MFNVMSPRGTGQTRTCFCWVPKTCSSLPQPPAEPATGAFGPELSEVQNGIRRSSRLGSTLGSKLPDTGSLSLLRRMAFRIDHDAIQIQTDLLTGLRAGSLAAVPRRDQCSIPRSTRPSWGFWAPHPELYFKGQTPVSLPKLYFRAALSS